MAAWLFVMLHLMNARSLWAKRYSLGRKSESTSCSRVMAIGNKNGTDSLDVHPLSDTCKKQNAEMPSLRGQRNKRIKEVLARADFQFALLYV